MPKKISIIIPCFNVEAYIERCAQSLFRQTMGMEHLELIFINDASTDHTLDRLTELEALYPEDIMIINSSENLRQGGARNIGLQYASADYIAFLDSDDWVEPRMYEVLLNKMLENDCDFVCCNFKRVQSEDEPMGRTGLEDHLVIVDTEEARKSVLVNNSGYGGIGSKLYKKQFITDHELTFPEHLAYEDNYWGTLVDLYVKKYYVVEEYFYHYFVNPESTIMTTNRKYHFDRLKIELLKIEELKARGVFKQYYEEWEYNFLNFFYINTLNIIFTRFTYIPIEVLRIMQRSVREHFPNYQNNKYMLSHKNQVNLALLQTVDVDLDLEGWAEIKTLY